VPRFHEELIEHLRTDGGVLAGIRDAGELSDEGEEKLKKELDHFVSVFNVEEERGLAG
jgi:F-type H+-transporting ATPase subunit alpha